jgi:hypothetical protein
VNYGPDPAYRAIQDTARRERQAPIIDTRSEPARGAVWSSVVPKAEAWQKEDK